VYSLTMNVSRFEPAARSYGLSPMQSGMLFQHVLEASANASSEQDGAAASSGYDIEQLCMVLAESIDAESFAAAFSRVAARHPILSSAFRWDDGDAPTQHVVGDVRVPVTRDDWRGLTATACDERRQDYLANDRRRGFDLRVAPLMRVAVFEKDGNASEVIWTFHHIVLDGRSFGPVLREVFALYEAMLHSRTLDIERTPPPRPYSDYVDWLATLDKSKSLDHFRELLRGKATPTSLPCAEPAGRPLAREGYGEAVQHVNPSTVVRLHALASRTSTTPGTVVQAAWALVLARFSGDDDIVFGSTRACRRSALNGDADTMVGLFINTLPVRVNVSSSRTVRDVLNDVREQSLALRDHEHTSLVDIHGVSAIPRSSPLFESIVMFENRSLERGIRVAGDPVWEARSFSLHEQPSPPLTVTVFDDAQFELRILFDRRLFRDEVATRIAASLAQALSALAEDEDRSLGDVEVLAAEERQKVISTWNDSARPYPDELCIHELFEARVASQPDALAVTLATTSPGAPLPQLTYFALEERANKLAHALRARGAKPGVFVGICLERGLDLVVALLAVAKSGAAYVPLEPTYPAGRIAFMLDDANALVVVTESRHRALFASPKLVIDGEDASEVERSPASRPPRIGSSADRAYAIFTSGSTGTPKGVVLSHRAVVNTLDWVSRTLRVAPGDRLLFVTSPCFDLSVYDTFGVLGAGATVVVATSDTLKEPEDLAAAVVESGITIWDSAPAALARLVPFFSIATARRPSVLRLAMLSGDWIPLTLPDSIREAFPAAEVMSLGGATEAAIWSNYFAVGALDPRWTSIPYGRPIQNSRYHVLDARLKPVPVGVTGDLYIGGTCLADGYLNRQELTAERFIQDAVSGITGERLYKTGDLARYFDDGELEFLGRADFQVKIRGFRVELGEVEAAIAALPGVRETVCVAHADASGQKSLIAYIVPIAGATIDEHLVKESLAKNLLEFMVPSQVISLDALPLSSNGKVDRKALPAPGARSRGSEYVAPSTSQERDMVALWEQVLGRAPVGVTDNFFALGGHSLLAVLLVSRARKSLGLELALSQILKFPTVSTLLAATRLDVSEPRPHPHVVTLNAGRGSGDKPHVFLVSGIGGYGFVFQRLASLLGRDQPLHTLQAIDAEGDGPVAELSIEEMAAIYEREVLAVSTRSPIVLGGYSFGVLIAYALADRLRKRGIAVPLLVSFDGFAPGFPAHLPLPARLMAHAREFFRGDAKGRRAYIEGRVTNVKARVYKLLGRPELSVADIPNADEALNLRMRKLAAALWAARSRYAPSGNAPCELLLIKTESSTSWLAVDMDDPLYGWTSFVRGPIHLESVPGEHLTMFSADNGRRLAGVIEAHVARLGVINANAAEV
jgi:amino acid adenylation domain-containing protein